MSDDDKLAIICGTGPIPGGIETVDKSCATCGKTVACSVVTFRAAEKEAASRDLELAFVCMPCALPNLSAEAANDLRILPETYDEVKQYLRGQDEPCHAAQCTRSGVAIVGPFWLCLEHAELARTVQAIIKEERKHDH